MSRIYKLTKKGLHFHFSDNSKILGNKNDSQIYELIRINITRRPERLDEPLLCVISEAGFVINLWMSFSNNLDLLYNYMFRIFILNHDINRSICFCAKICCMSTMDF